MDKELLVKCLTVGLILIIGFYKLNKVYLYNLALYTLGRGIFI